MPVQRLTAMSVERTGGAAHQAAMTLAERAGTWLGRMVNRFSRFPTERARAKRQFLALEEKRIAGAARFARGIAQRALADESGRARAGFVLWAVAYALIVRRGFRQKTYGIPWPSICLNIAWEFYMGVFCPSPASSPDEKYLCRAKPLDLLLVRVWFALNLVNLFQFLVFGRENRPRLFRRNFFWIVGAVLVAAFAGQRAFIRQEADRNGTKIAWIINLVMSVLFLAFFFRRPDMRGLSYGAAWAKMFGSLLMAPPSLKPNVATGFRSFLVAMVFLADCCYIALLAARRRQLAGDIEPIESLAVLT
jgi:hypothetical protein